MTMQNCLTDSDHRRDFSGMKYIYPVVSRRAGGVSIGINLNHNNACNWRCIYCQVPNLIRGIPPPVDLDILERELRALLTDILHGDFMQRYVAEGDRVLQDIAFSGNGEPTSAKAFPQVVLLVEKVLRDFNLLDSGPEKNHLDKTRLDESHQVKSHLDKSALEKTYLNKPIKIRLITNGSLLDRPAILEAVRHLARCNGEVWFKIDAGTRAGIARINDVNLNPQSHIQRLNHCAKACPTFIQTCLFALDGQPPQESEMLSYLALINQVKQVIQGVHLYGLARPSLQPEASRLSRLSPDWLDVIAQRIRQLGISVKIWP